MHTEPKLDHDARGGTAMSDTMVTAQFTPDDLADVAQALHREADKIHTDMRRARQHIEGVWGQQGIPDEVQRAMAWAEDRGVYEHHNLHDIATQLEELLEVSGPHEAITHA